MTADLMGTWSYAYTVDGTVSTWKIDSLFLKIFLDLKCL